MKALAAAALPPGMENPFDKVEATLAGSSPLTMATYLGVDADHYTIYNVQRARDLAISFLTSALAGTPVLE